MNKARPIQKTILLCISCLVLGYLCSRQYKSIQKTPEEAFVEGKSYAVLAEDMVALYDKNAALEAQRRALKEQLQDLSEAQNNQFQLEEFFLEEKEQMYETAGFVPVSGEGIAITVLPNMDSPISSNLLLQMINELKASGAYAISINGQRLLPTSEIREITNGFSVNRVAFSYENNIEIYALGDKDDLYRSIDMNGGIIDKWIESHIDVNVAVMDLLVIPAMEAWQEDLLRDHYEEGELV